MTGRLAFADAGFACALASLAAIWVKPSKTAQHLIVKMHFIQCHNKVLPEQSIRTPAIRVSALTKSIQTAAHRVDILRGIDFDVQPGEFVAIMGPSGSGKSTLLGLLAGLDTPTSGKIILDGEDITGLDEDRMAVLRGRKVGFVFQSYHLLPTLTAEENVLLPYELTGGNGPEGRKRARELLESVGLPDRRDHYPVQLSGGEQQRVALARAFMVRPPILLADEPTGNLDSQNGQHVLDLLIALNQREKTTLVLVTHDTALSSRADRRITLSDGRIVSDEGGAQ
jgi:putative ABC transport system ATP-binding protein